MYKVFWSPLTGSKDILCIQEACLRHSGNTFADKWPYHLSKASEGPDNYVSDLICKGIGYHHAGMDLQDRKSVEETFASGNLPVLGKS